jgi:hypothetical protein
MSRLLANANRNHANILPTAYKQPFSVKGFGNMMSNAIRETGLPGRCKPHGLRKAAARRLAEAGCSASEIMAITGHKTLAEVERYTRAAEQARLARQAMNRQLKTESGKPSFDKVANTTDELIEINSLINQMALPRGLQYLNDTNTLAKGGTTFHSMASQCFLPRVSHRFRLMRHRNWAERTAPVLTSRGSEGQGVPA